MDTPRVFSVVTPELPAHPSLDRLVRSAKTWGWDHKIYFVEEINRVTYRGEQEGLLQALLDSDFPEKVVYLDGWDTMFVGPPQELTFEEGILNFCGDLRCFPNEEPSALFPRQLDGEFRFLNCGVIWGDGKLLADLCEEYLDLENSLCNQDFFNAAWVFDKLTGGDSLRIDTRAQSALNLWGMYPKFSQIGRKNKRVWYKPSDTTPVILHAAGSSSFHALPPMPEVALV